MLNAMQRMTLGLKQFFLGSENKGVIDYLTEPYSWSSG